MKKMNKLSLMLSLFVAFLTTTLRANESFNGYTITSEGAWCWFADPRAIHYENESGTINSSYIGYIDVHGSVRATQYNFLTGKREEVLVRSCFQPDDHNNPTFLVLPDERVLIIYSRHTDEAAFYYRVSNVPGDITTLGEEKCIKTNHNTTYPSPFILSDDPDHFYMCWRGLGWHPTIAKFTLPDANGDVKTAWGPYQMVQSTGARPYAKYHSNGKDKLYVTYTTGHPDNEQPNWVYFNVININAKNNNGVVTTNPTLEDIKGNTLSTIANGKFNVNKTDSYKSSYPYTIVDAPTNMRDWVWQITTDTDTNPVIAMVRINGGKSQHEYFYAKWTGSQWRLTDLANGGGRFHPSNTEYCYSGGEAIDPANPKVIYLSIPTIGVSGKSVYEIWKYTLNDNGVIVSKEQITKNSEKNNVRPYVLPGSADSKLRLTWMYGDYYYWMVKKEFPLGYPTGIHCDYEYPETITSIVDTPTGNKSYGGKVMTTTTVETEALPATEAFTFNMSLKLSPSAYYGTLFTIGNLSYGISQTTVKPYININGSKYDASNALYTSDDWASNSSGTSGDSWPTKLGTFNITLTYDGNQLTIYRNGLIDQRINGVSLESEDVKIGGFEGNLYAVQTYSECLNQDEVKYMLRKGILEALWLPTEVMTDVVLPTKLNGENIVWTSNNEDILAVDGTFVAPEEVTEVKLTASIGTSVREFVLQAQPRIALVFHELLRYDFNGSNDTYNVDGTVYVKDHSGKGNDLMLQGGTAIDETLNLTSNTSTGFSTNGYGVVPAGVMDSLRSYTVLLEATPKVLSASPRFYDFGFNSGNSLFFRANPLAAGIKYNGGTTTMVSANASLEVGRTYKLAVTYDARQGVTSIYVDGVLVGSGKENVNEPYMIAALQETNRSYIGRTQWWDSNVANDNGDYVGTIDNFYLFNVALTLEEIAAMQEIRLEDESLNVNCTERLLNPDFEGTYSVKSGTGVVSDRAIYQPQNWTVSYSSGNENDMTILNSSCLYSSLFTSVPLSADNGDNAYLARQKWGTSTIGLKQTVDTIPAGYYRLSAVVWQSGSGGSANVWAQRTGKTKVLATSTSSGVWGKTSVIFTTDGVKRVNVGVEAVHSTNGEEKICGFDNLTLYDVTINRSEYELAELLGDMVKASGSLLAKDLPNETMRTALSDATESAKPLTQDNTHEQLYDAYVALRDAIRYAQNPNYTGIVEVSQELQNKIQPVYDLSGRKVADDATSQSDKLQKGIYIIGNKKTYVK